MKKYTANYAYTNPNFTIQNLKDNEIASSNKDLLYVLKNLLQRGYPTILSQFLQQSLGEIHNEDDFNTPFVLISPHAPKWINTIKGDEKNQYYPAKDFLETTIPQDFGDFAFIQKLLLPEVKINEIVGIENERFHKQQVDFYLPQARLVIEIDGQQHKNNDIIRIKDTERDEYLAKFGVKVIRIDTKELKNGDYKIKVDEIISYLRDGRLSRVIALNKVAYNSIVNNELDESIIKKKILPTAIIRFQILLIELLLNQYLDFESDWKFNLILKRNEPLGDFAKLAIEDFLLWYGQLHKLKTKEDFTSPNYEINTSDSIKDYDTRPEVINIDFSLFDRWTDINSIYPVIFVRTDYFGTEKNYFQVSCTDRINYQITKDDESTIAFFLQNIFGHSTLRPGQFPIIASALNGEDTVGLLPTGSGKSLCYQLPCLLQPSVSFVVCPIKSLMYDQAANMKSIYITNVNSITGDLTQDERQRVQYNFSKGKYLFIWISPERFQSLEFREYIAKVNTNFAISYAVIDEVHCMSEWGHDFRTSYLNLTKTIQKFTPNAAFIGLTATASVNVLKNIKVEFSRNHADFTDDKVKAPLDYSREELEFEVILDNGNKIRTLEKIINDKGIIEESGNACLIFTPHVNGPYGCYTVSNKLNTLCGLNQTKWYSGEVPEVREIDHNGQRTGRRIPVLGDEEFKKYKQAVQRDFKQSKFPVLVATKAFGMGIDKNNINYTVHYGLPSSIESLYQEAGRAGRWTDKTKKAKCYVLYSQETVEQQLIDKLFDPNSTITEINAINNEVGRNGNDIFRQIFLFLNGQRVIEEDFKIIKLIYGKYCKAKKKIILFNDVISELRNNSVIGEDKQIISVVQKAIYRLRLLGIINDWTTDFVTHYEVQYNSIDENHIKDSLYSFISKYKPDINIELELSRVNKKTTLDKCIYFLLKWTYDNIVYTRRQSLKNLKELCDNFEKNGSESFKRTIDNYFRITETTFIYQHIAENPRDYEKWFDVFYIGRDLIKQEKGTFVPKIIDKERKQKEFEKLRDGLGRFLESYLNNVGLNLISGLIRLSLNDYGNEDGQSRFEMALREIKNTFNTDSQGLIINHLKRYGNYLSEDGKGYLCASIMRFFPELTEELAEYYGLYYLLDDSIKDRKQRLRLLINKLNDEYEQIG